MKLKLYKAVRYDTSERKQYRFEITWSIDVDPQLKERGHNWFKNALNKEVWDIEQDQLDIRNQFPLSGIDQGDLLCIGGSQCYII